MKSLISELRSGYALLALMLVLGVFIGMGLQYLSVVHAQQTLEDVVPKYAACNQYFDQGAKLFPIDSVKGAEYATMATACWERLKW